MAAPALVAAAKLAAKHMTKKAVSKATKGGDGGGMSSGAKSILAIVTLFVLVFTGSIIHGINTTVGLLAPQNIVECNGPTTSYGDAPWHEAGEGKPDGTFGSDVPFPEKDTTRIVEPVPNPVITSGFGYRAAIPGVIGALFHNGLDYGQPLGSPVFAMADGIVAQSAPNNNSYGYGTVVTLHHLINGEKYSTTYGHILPSGLPFKVGDTVKAGDRIAYVGSEGSSTGAHLHFLITKGVYSIAAEYNKDAANNVDPVAFFKSNGAEQVGGDTNIDGSPLAPGETAPSVCSKTSTADGSIVAWGGFDNGEIPDGHLKPLSFATGFRLETSAAKTLESLNKEYQAQFGKPLPIVSAYMSVQDQGKPAGEGTSIHGWAKSVELSDSIIKFNSPEYKWLSENSSKHSWMNPKINQKGGSSPLATRWVYAESTSAPGGLTDSNQYKAYAQTRLKALGLGERSEMTCLDSLWQRESGWNPKADNPTSDAMGIPQAMMPAHFGSDWQTNKAGRNFLDNPEVQIDWGLNYIQGRYKTPCSAWAHSESVNWY